MYGRCIDKSYFCNFIHCEHKFIYTLENKLLGLTQLFNNIMHYIVIPLMHDVKSDVVDKISFISNKCDKHFKMNFGYKPQEMFALNWKKFYFNFYFNKPR
jgi:hypothetical protein